MIQRQAFTLIEILFVLIIVGICVAFALPNFTNSNEQAMALNARNNLLSIYSAEQNYYVNNGHYYTQVMDLTVPCATRITQLNNNLNVNIQNDGHYTYDCVNSADPNNNPSYECDAFDDPACGPGSSSASIKMDLLMVGYRPIQLNGSKSYSNPACTPSAGGSQNWCP